MKLVGNIIKNALQLSTRFNTGRRTSAIAKQRKQLRTLLKKAADTEFGKHYHFEEILKQRNGALTAFRANVPIHDYNSLFKQWWYKNLEGGEDICWPGKVKYFALSSGTSESASKRIPITKDMLRSIKKTQLRQIACMSNYPLNPDTFWKGALLLGGSTKLTFKHTYYEGDLSGINAKHRPFWFERYYKPGKKISDQRNWEEKLDQIVENAHKWDIGCVVGVPAWMQLLMEKIIEHNGVKTIHDVWPNLDFYIYSGVAFAPYEKAFAKLFGKHVHTMECYLASEGFFAYQTKPHQKAMNLVLNNEIFYEFVPFNENNFDEDGNILPNAYSYLIDQVKEGIDYAIVISTCAGTWRYLIGDTVRFTNVEEAEIVITGRTKHFLSVTGEHLSVENMVTGLEQVSNEMNLIINEFTVCSEEHGDHFAHRWYLGVDEAVINELDRSKIKRILDEKICEINDDYATERTSALKDVFIELVPVQRFNEFLEKEGRVGAQIKFPRVLKKAQLERWKGFLS